MKYLMESSCLPSLEKFKLDQPVKEDSPNLASLMAGEPFTTSVSAAIPIDALPSQQAASYTFDFTNEPIPAGVTEWMGIVIPFVA